jgi:dUTP pyrophosphatase
MKVKIKRLHKDAVVPKYSKNGDAGLDLTAVSQGYDEHGNTVYSTGLAFEIPKGFVGLLFPRSSNSRTNLRLTNSVGVIDSSYRGEVSMKFRNDSFAGISPLLKNDLINGEIGFSDEYKIGDRVGQIIILPYPQIEFQEVDELSTTERGSGSFGSTGK